MKVHVAGRHVKVTPALQQYAEEKAGKLDRFFDRIQHVDVVLGVTSDGNHEVEMSAVLVRGVHLVGKASAEDMYQAIDVAEHKLQRQIQRFHDRLREHRDRTRIAHGAGKAAPPAEEETYEQVVREMLEEED